MFNLVKQKREVVYSDSAEMPEYEDWFDSLKSKEQDNLDVFLDASILYGKNVKNYGGDLLGFRDLNKGGMAWRVYFTEVTEGGKRIALLILGHRKDAKRRSGNDQSQVIKKARALLLQYKEGVDNETE